VILAHSGEAQGISIKKLPINTGQRKGGVVSVGDMFTGALEGVGGVMRPAPVDNPAGAAAEGVTGTFDTTPPGKTVGTGDAGLSLSDSSAALTLTINDPEGS